MQPHLPCERTATRTLCRRRRRLCMAPRASRATCGCQQGPRLCPLRFPIEGDMNLRPLESHCIALALPASIPSLGPGQALFSWHMLGKSSPAAPEEKGWKKGQRSRSMQYFILWVAGRPQALVRYPQLSVEQSRGGFARSAVNQQNREGRGLQVRRYSS